MERQRDGASDRAVDRREFLRRGALGGAAVAGGAFFGLPAGGDGEARGELPREAPVASPAEEARQEECDSGELPSFRLEGMDVADLQEEMRTGGLSAVKVAALYMERIEALDRQGPALRHVLEVNPDALSVASDRDRERRDGRVRGALHGIPVLLKDNVDTGDRMSTSAGSLALAGRSAAGDAFLVERLREEGAVILGKLNLSEWANFRSRESSSGWSARGGQGRNPYVLARSPCGSSSGSAAAVAAEYAPVAVGTETNGSIMCPASANSVVGVKPTVGLVSRSGIIPISHTQDTAGPFGKTVRDAAVLLGAMAGVDPRDDATADARGHLQRDYTRFLDPEALKGARIGVPRSRLSGFTEETDRLFEEVLEVLKEAGAVLVDPADVPHLGDYGRSEFTVLLYEFKHDLNAYLAARGGDLPVRTLADLIRFNEENAAREMPYFGQDIFESAQEKGGLEEEEYRKALDEILRLSREGGIDAAFREHDLDAMVALTSAPAWPIDLVNGDSGHGSSYSPWAIAGYPGVTLPAGYVFGLPVNVSFYGRAWDEPKLLGYAHAYERATEARKPPEFRVVTPVEEA